MYGRTSPTADRPDGGAPWYVRVQFESTDEVSAMLKRVGYLSDAAIASAVYLGERLGKPVLSRGRPAPARPSWPSPSRRRPGGG